MLTEQRPSDRSRRLPFRLFVASLFPPHTSYAEVIRGLKHMAQILIRKFGHLPRLLNCTPTEMNIENLYQTVALDDLYCKEESVTPDAIPLDSGVVKKEKTSSRRTDDLPPPSKSDESTFISFINEVNDCYLQHNAHSNNSEPTKPAS